MGGHDRELSLVARVVHPDAVQRRRGRKRARLEQLLGAGDDLFAVEETALVPADEQATGAVAQRERRAVAAARRGSGNRQDLVRGRELLRGAQKHAAVRDVRLRVLDIVDGVDREQLPAEVLCAERLSAHQ